MDGVTEPHDPLSCSESVTRPLGGFINADLALAAITLRYRMVPDATETIFAVARIAGWVAHAIEEYREPGCSTARRGVYAGVRPSTQPRRARR